MTFCRRATLFVIACLLLAPAARAQQTQSGAPQGMPQLPKPGPEHEVFKEDAGTWDAVVESYIEPGKPATTSKGVEVNTIGCGGLCLITDFKGEMMPGTTFHGHGTSTWDPAKKKYVGSWTDSMSAGLMVAEATWDPATRTSTGFMEGPDMSGKMVKMKSVVEYKGGGRVMTMYGPGPDGKEAVMMRITYSRRK